MICHRVTSHRVADHRRRRRACDRSQRRLAQRHPTRIPPSPFASSCRQRRAHRHTSPTTCPPPAITAAEQGQQVEPSPLLSNRSRRSRSPPSLCNRVLFSCSRSHSRPNPSPLQRLARSRLLCRHTTARMQLPHQLRPPPSHSPCSPSRCSCNRSRWRHRPRLRRLRLQFSRHLLSPLSA